MNHNVAESFHNPSKSFRILTKFLPGWYILTSLLFFSLRRLLLSFVLRVSFCLQRKEILYCHFAFSGTLQEVSHQWKPSFISTTRSSISLAVLVWHFNIFVCWIAGNLGAIGTSAHMLSPVTIGLRPLWLARLDTTKHFIEVMVKSAYEPSSPSVRSLSRISTAWSRNEYFYSSLDQICPGLNANEIQISYDIIIIIFI